MLRTLTRAAAEYLAVLHRDGTTAGIMEKMFDFKRVNKLIGTDEMLAIGRKYTSE
jgi:hypothetical protein